jgi:iron-sulfur cluster assembly accessory protein
MIQLSDSATSEVLRLKARCSSPDLKLRLGVQASGCLGLSYSLNFDPTAHPDDCLWTTNGIQIVVSTLNLPYLDGLVIDYSEDLMGGGFRFHNPNTAQTCGCGVSFAPKPPSTTL